MLLWITSKALKPFLINFKTISNLLLNHSNLLLFSLSVTLTVIFPSPLIKNFYVSLKNMVKTTVFVNLDKILLTSTSSLTMTAKKTLFLTVNSVMFSNLSKPISNLSSLLSTSYFMLKNPKIKMDVLIPCTLSAISLLLMAFLSTSITPKAVLKLNS